MGRATVLVISAPEGSAHCTEMLISCAAASPWMGRARQISAVTSANTRKKPFINDASFGIHRES